MMKLVNGEKVIFDRLVKAISEWDRIRGLMFRKDKLGMIIETRFGIHSFFVFYALTILICDEKWKVVKIRKKLRPFSLFFWNPKFKRAIELPFYDYKVKIGDKLKFE